MQISNRFPQIATLVGVVAAAGLFALPLVASAAGLAPAPSPCDTVGTPFLTFTQNVSNDPDSGNNGNWATDAFTENGTVWVGTDGQTYCANVNTTNGTFVTTGPNSPEAGSPLAAGITGTFTGGENYTLPSSLTLNPAYSTATTNNVTLPANDCDGSSASTDCSDGAFSKWVNDVFTNANSDGSTYVNTYSLTYDTANNGTWTDADPTSGGDSGDITGSPSVVYVSTSGNDSTGNGTQAAPYATVQKGIDEVNAGGTVNVAAGTYTEQDTITKDVTLTGAGASNTTIAAPSTLTADANGNTDIIDIGSTASPINVTISGFTVTGPGPSGCNSLSYGIYVGNQATANINNNTISDIADSPLSGCQNGRAIGAGNGSGDTATLTATSNTISGYQKTGIIVEGTGSTATITDNTVTGTGSTATIAQNGIELVSGATATISGNTVTGNEYSSTVAGNSGGSDPINDVQSAGILLYQAAPGVTITGNTTSGNDMGIYNLLNGVGTTTISNNTDSDRYEGILLDGGSADVTNNTITGSNIGIGAISYSGETMDTIGDLTGNTINGSTDSGIKVLTDGSSANTFNDLITANSNSIAGNTVGVTNDASTSIDATMNWWGSATGPTISSNPGGTGDSIVDGNASSSVSYSPWLCAAGSSQTTTTSGGCSTSSSSSSSSGSGSSSSSGGGGGGGNGPIAGGGGGGGGFAPTALPNNGSTGGVAGTTVTTTTTGSTGGQVLGASAYNFTTNFGYGATGEDVTQLQAILIADGYLKISAPTGWFGPLTKSAVMKYQSANGIPDTGFVGVLTRGSLNAGVTPTSSTELQSLEQELQSLEAQIAAMEASSTTH